MCPGLLRRPCGFLFFCGCGLFLGPWLKELASCGVWEAVPLSPVGTGQMDAREAILHVQGGRTHCTSGLQIPKS